MFQATGGVSSSITSNFNGTAIPAGDTIWFSAVLKLNGTVPKSAVNIAVHNSTIQFTAGGTNYSLNVPAAVVTFSPTVTTSAVTFDAANNPSPVWLENQLNPQPSGNTLLQAFAFPVPAGGLPGGIQNVTWQSSFSSDTANIALNWQWAAAVYTGCVSTTYNSDDVKPTDDASASIYKNSDHAGTPEACKNDVAQGGTGGGGSNYTGSLSGTASVTPAVVSASPAITASISPAPNSAHWNNSNVTVSFTCSDPNFAIATCPAPVAVTTEGAGQVITGTAVDQSGATATTSITVNLDKTSPSITADATSASGGGNVLTLPVTVTFTCSDALSGVASCPAPIQVTTPGAHEVFGGTATDNAGNTASASISINTEQSPLAMTASLSPPPVNGWNNTAVNITYKCMGGVPPVQCPQGTTVPGEGQGQVISATATDAVGQSTTLNTSVNIDETPPTVTATATPTPNPAGWNTTDVTISYECSDNLSGVAFCPPQQVVSNEGKGQQITASATDNAGNNSAPVTTTLNIEKTVPGITATQSPAANAAGWNNSDVTVKFTCTKSVSDLVSCPDQITVITEGKDQPISGVVTDQAGKSNTVTIPVSLDKTPPSIVIATPITLPIVVSYSDSGSGIDTTSFKVTIDGVDHTSDFSVTATGATGSPVLLDGTHVIVAMVSDLAGNQASPAPASFALDGVPPTISITAPVNGSFTNNNHPAITALYSDIGSGVDTASFKLTIDGTDHTSEFVTMATGASGTPVAALVDGGHNIVATVSDLAGNPSTPATANVTIDTIPPTISITTPLSGSFSKTNQPTIDVTYSDSGSGINTSSFKLTIDGTDHTAEFTATASGASGSPAAALADGSRSIVATISDQAGNTSSATSNVTIDTSLPSISITAPANNSFTNNNRPAISVTFGSTANPASFKLTVDGVDHTPELAVTATGASGSLASPLSDGNHAIVATVSDQAGNSSSATASLTIDTAPPQITISQPANQSFTNANSLTVTGTVIASAPISSVTVDGVAASLSGGSFNAVVSLGPEGPQAIAVSAIDAAGNTGQTTVTVIIDRTPPVVTLNTPSQISKLHPGQINVTATDNLSGVNQVVVSVNSQAIATFTSPPYQTTLSVPSGSNPGDTLTVTAVATDKAGNTGSAPPHGVSVAGDNNVIVGQVLNDADSLPLQSANVQMIATTPAATQTDDRGRYSLQASDSHLFLSISGTIPATPPAQPTPTTTVEREVFVQQGVGTVPVDARLTPLTKAVTVGSAGGTLAAGPISITVPASAVVDGTGIQLTQLSGQGLPGLLPLGWSPLAAFDLRSTASLANLSGTVNAFPNVVSYLVTYSPALHAWTMVTPPLQPASGSVNFTMPSAGDYALVVPDAATPPVPVPDVGAALTGIPVQALDPATVSGGSLSPAVLPPGGGTATATLGVQSPSFAPSGTVIQANIAETFSLASGDTVSEQSRSEDLVLYNALAPANATMGAQFPVTPSHKYSNSQLLTGKVHLDILAGREGVRGQPGGNDPLTISDGIATLSVPGGALGQDTAISVQSTALENFVPTSSTLNALQEVLVDLSGEKLNTPAQLSIAATGLNPNDIFVLAQVQRIGGVPHVVAIAQAQINAGSLISFASPGLPGVIQGGEYIFYDISNAAGAGFVQGVAATSAGPVQALVSADSLQIVSITGTDGRYTVPALAGTVNLKATGTTTSIAGTASTQLAAGQTATVNIQLNGVVNTATMSPADKSLGVDPTGIITVTSPVPLNPQSIAQTNLSLFQGSPAAPGTQVSLLPFVLSTSGTVLTVTPAQNLAAATQYTFQATGLADMGGGAIIVPTSTFTTKANQPLTFDPNQITFSFPDANGNIHVSAPAGSLPPGTKVMIVDQSNAVVLSLTAFNDGSLSGDFPGTISDVLQVTATDPTGATSTFTRSQFVAADGSVAVGPGGGTVTGPGGVELRIPEGALDQGVSFKIESFGPDLFPERPDVPGGTFGGGLKITSPKPVAFKKEAKLAFPRPAGAPPGAFFQVYGRVQAPNGQVAFEDLDYALPEGQGATAKVVTASFPFRGVIDLNMLLSNADYAGQALDLALFSPGSGVISEGLEAVDFIIWMANDILPGVSLGGSVTGRVRYPVPPGGTLADGSINKTGDTVFVGVPNVLVTVDSNPPSHALIGGATGAVTQPDGTFTFSDPHYNGGPVNLIAYDGNGHAVTASAIEAVALTDKTVNDFAGPLLPFYKNVAFADIVVPAPAPPPPTPQIGINLFTENPSSNPPGLRVPVTGIVTAGTSLVIAFKTGAQISGLPNVTINGVPYATQNDQPKVASDPNTLDSELTTPFVPGNPGIYTLTATALTAFAQPVTASKSFVVIAAGGSNNTINVGTAPIIAGVTPVAGATGVTVDTFVQVLFSEPVTNLAGHVSLVPGDGSAPPPLKLSGVDYRNGTTVIANLSATDAVASMTIQPLTGLKFNTTYTVQVTTDVVDLDNVADPTKPALHFVPPQNQNPPVVPYDFTTFGPQVLGGTPAFGSTRPVVLGQRAYVGLPSFRSQIQTYDISDPANPVQIPTSTDTFYGHVFEMAGEENSPLLGGGNLLAAVAGFANENILIPSNLWLYNVSGDKMTRVAGISVTSSSVNVGQGTRVAVKGNFAYVSIVPAVGIEVVDLQQGINDYNAAFATDLRQFGVGITTDGQGFANDAIVNTIPVKDSTGRLVFMSAIKADDFVVPGSDPQNPVTQTFVVATGNAPGTSSPTPISLAVIDPTQPGSSAVVYAGQPQLGIAKLTAGTALALGQLTDSVLDASGNPVVKPVALVTGWGVAPDPANPGQTTPFLLAVLDMTVPSTPQVLSVLGLPTFPTDVLLKDTTALIGTGQNEVLLVNLVDPRNPVNAGVISNPSFGDRLALSDNGFLLGTSMNALSGGIHTATFTPFLGLSNTPILARITGIDQLASASKEPVLLASLAPVLPAAPPQSAPPATTYEAIADAVVSAHVFLALPTGNGMFLLDRTACGLGSVQIPLNFGNGVKFTQDAKITIPKGTQFCATTVPFSANVNTDHGNLTGSRQAPVGTVTLLVDSNNDTNVDDKDKPLTHTKAFQFWEQDPNYRILTTSSVTDVKTTKGMADYASLRLIVNGAFPPGSLSLKMDDGFPPGTPNDSMWGLVEKTAPGNLYLTDQNASATQISQVVGLCNHDPNSIHMDGQCFSGSDGTIPLPLIQNDIRDFLFTCRTCPTETSRKLKVIYTDPSGGSPQQLDFAKVDIRPLGELISIRSARQQLKGGQPTPLFNAVQGWSATPSSDASQITVFVHGFDNSEADVITDNIPTYAKRLYWSQHPILQAQKAGFMGVSWPSNPGVPKFPQGELLGLETGVPFACLLKELKAGNAPTLNIVAHSLGNMVVNSALQRMGQGIVDNYVMNEPALPAETFHDPSTAFLPGETNSTYTTKVQKLYGYPDDKDWFSRPGAWLDMVAGQPAGIFGPDFTDFNRWNTTVSTLPAPKPFYYERWTQQRPAGGVPDTAAQDSHNHRGPWKGFFFGNVAKVSGNFVNTWSIVDAILGAPVIGTGAWDFMQRLQKPTVGFIGLGTVQLTPFPTILNGDITDERQLQFWAVLGSAPAQAETIWNGGCDLPQPNHYNIIRQWQELSLWFESLSIAAGNGPVPNSNIQNLNFTSLSLSLSPSTTHSYMTAKHFYEVRDGFIQLKNLFRQPL